jgi:acetone carboxylase gamma subunit
LEVKKRKFLCPSCSSLHKGRAKTRLFLDLIKKEFNLDPDSII